MKSDGSKRLRRGSAGADGRAEVRGPGDLYVVIYMGDSGSIGKPRDRIFFVCG